MIRSTLRYTLPVLACALLSACGGGGDSGSSPSASASTLTGSLTDSPIAGISYVTAPSGKHGVTDANGHFDYVSGDTVTFSLGAIQLGTVTATGTITPLGLASDGNSGTDDSARAQNLLIFFQSLDSDHDPDNGITIPASAATAATSNIDIKGSADLGSDTQFNTLLTNAGGQLVSAEDAKAHFKKAFLSNLTGVWVLYKYNNDTPGVTLVVRFDGATQQYMEVEAGKFEQDFYDGIQNTINANALTGLATAGQNLALPSGHTGTEVGKFDWDPLTGRFTATPDCDGVAGCTADSNGTWGFSNIDPTVFSYDGDDLLATSSNGDVARLKRVGQDGSTLQGAWVLGNQNFVTPMLILMGSGGNHSYLLADPFGDADCGQAGAELGTPWIYSAADGTLAFGPSPYYWLDWHDSMGLYPDGHSQADTVVQADEVLPMMDTNGCGGFREFNPKGNLPVTISTANNVEHDVVFTNSTGMQDDTLLIGGNLLYRVPNNGTLTLVTPP